MAIFDEKKFTATSNNGVATVSYEDEAAFKNGTDIPYAEMKRTFDYAGQYIEEATTTSAKYAENLMKKDKSVDKVIVELPYGMSKRGSVAVTANREKTFPGMKLKDGQKRPDVTKSTIGVIVRDAAIELSRPKIKDMEQQMTKTLLG